MIKVRVAYQADPEQAIESAGAVRRRTPRSCAIPPPVVVLDDLGDQALDFSVRVFLADINRSLHAQTELRTRSSRRCAKTASTCPIQPGCAARARAAPVGKACSRSIGVASLGDPEEVHDVLARGGAAQRPASGRRGQRAGRLRGLRRQRARLRAVTCALADGVKRRCQTALRTQASRPARARHRRGEPAASDSPARSGWRARVRHEAGRGSARGAATRQGDEIVETAARQRDR